MKRIFTLILLAGAMLASANAQTKTENDRWIEAVVSTDYTTTVYIDTRTIRRDGDTLVLWERFQYRSGGKLLTRAQIRRDGYYRFLAGRLYDANGSVIEQSDTPMQWKEAAPESLQDYVNQWFDVLMAMAPLTVVKSWPVPGTHM